VTVLDFLFEGRPPQSVNTYGETVDNIPKWMSDYTQGLIGRANVIAAEPYQAYEGPRIAGFDPSQLAAFDLTQQSVGSYQPHLEGATGLTTTAGGTNPLNVAAPFLAQSAQSFPGQVDQYMDPYIDNVLNRQEELSQRNLTENLLPAVQESFIGSGAFGSDRMAEIMGRVGRDSAEGLQGQQLGALSQAYGQAGQLFGADRSRQLQAGATAGQLAGQTGELQLRAGQQLGALGEAQRRLQAGDAASLEAVGAQQRGLGQQSLDLAYDDFLRQQNYPREQLDWMSQIVRGLPSSRTTQTTRTAPLDGATFGASPLAQIAQLYATSRGTRPPTAQKRGGLMQYKEGGSVIEGDYEVVT